MGEGSTRASLILLPSDGQSARCGGKAGPLPWLQGTKGGKVSLPLAKTQAAPCKKGVQKLMKKGAEPLDTRKTHLYTSRVLGLGMLGVAA